MGTVPNRILKESIRVSETINALTWEEEVFFYRLLTACDDYGCFDGRSSVIRTALYPLRVDWIKEDKIETWLQRLVELNLLILYEVSGRRYLQVTSWNKHQRMRAQKSKFPLPPTTECHLTSDDVKRRQEETHDSVCHSESESESEYVVVDADAGKQEFIEFVNKHLATWPLAGEQYGRLLDYAEDLTWPVLLEAVKRTLGAGKQTINYCVGICRRWVEAELKTLEDVEMFEAKRKRGDGEPVSKRASAPPKNSATTELLREVMWRDAGH